MSLSFANGPYCLSFFAAFDDGGIDPSMHSFQLSGSKDPVAVPRKQPSTIHLLAIWAKSTPKGSLQT
jgi:hypothetical protein